MLGILGYGTLGKAVEYGFPRIEKIISDPQYNDISTADVIAENPLAIFICLPTPSDANGVLEPDILLHELKVIQESGYSGIVIVKSTVLPHYLTGFDVVHIPEFLSRATAFEDFIDPVMVVIGGLRGHEALDLYKKHSIIKNLDNKVFFTNIKTACILKYTMNSFYALKISFLNEVSEVCKSEGIGYDSLAELLGHQPWMGNHHFMVPGPDGEKGFGGPCLPKDTSAFMHHYDIKTLKAAMEVNEKCRH